MDKGWKSAISEEVALFLILGRYKVEPDPSWHFRNIEKLVLPQEVSLGTSKPATLR
jgi:hypothetical protein